MKKTVCLMLLAMSMLISVDSDVIGQQKRPISQETFERMIQNVPLILKGEITKVEIKLMTPYELYGRGNSTVHIPVTVVKMNVGQVIAGEYDSSQVTFIVPEGKGGGLVGKNVHYEIIKFNIGDHAIIAFNPNSRGTGYNIISRATRIFRVEGTKLIPYRKEFYLTVDNPLEVLARKAKERKITEVFKNSDLVCTGTVTKLINLNSPTRRYKVLIDTILKGTEEKSEITVDMSDIYLPSRLNKPGFRVFLFLKKSSSGYKPVAGINGYYVIDGEKLTRGHSTPVRMSVKQLTDNIKVWMETK